MVPIEEYTSNSNTEDEAKLFSGACDKEFILLSELSKFRWIRYHQVDSRMYPRYYVGEKVLDWERLVNMILDCTNKQRKMNEPEPQSICLLC